MQVFGQDISKQAPSIVPGPQLHLEENQLHTDLEKAIQLCDRHEPNSITICGRYGWPFRSHLYNIRLLKKYFDPKRSLMIYGNDSYMQVIANGEIEIKGKPGEYCAFMAVPDSAFITSKGLRWDMDRFELTLCRARELL